MRTKGTSCRRVLNLKSHRSLCLAMLDSYFFPCRSDVMFTLGQQLKEGVLSPGCDCQRQWQEEKNFRQGPFRIKALVAVTRLQHAYIVKDITNLLRNNVILKRISYLQDLRINWSMVFFNPFPTKAEANTLLDCIQIVFFMFQISQH